jgi:hypothetical protein
MLEARVLDTIADVARDQWNACFPGELETYDYLRAVEEARLPGFSWRYLVASDDLRILAAAPAFVTDYPLDTTLVGVARRVIESVRKAVPGALTLRLACIGSPCTETASIGFAPGVGADERAFLMRALMTAFERTARAARCGLLAIKDVPAPRQGVCEQVVRPLGYRPTPGLPSAHLDIDFADIESYLARLSPGTRKDMRRKLKSLSSVRIEVRRDLEGRIDDVMALYRDTRARAEMTFEELTPDYFTGVLARMGENALCVLYHVGDELLAANLLLADERTLLDKFFVMSAARGRAYNLYYLSWFTNLRLCLERGLKRYESGQAGYANKVRLGSRLTPTAMYFRHRNALVNGALQIAAPLFSMDPMAEVGAS